MISGFIEGKVTIFPEISEDFCICANDGSGILFLWLWECSLMDFRNSCNFSEEVMISLISSESVAKHPSF